MVPHFEVKILEPLWVQVERGFVLSVAAIRSAGAGKPSVKRWKMSELWGIGWNLDMKKCGIYECWWWFLDIKNVISTLKQCDLWICMATWPLNMCDEWGLQDGTMLIDGEGIMLNQWWWWWWWVQQWWQMVMFGNWKSRSFMKNRCTFDMLCDYHTHSKTLLVHSSEDLSLSIPHGFAPCHCVSLVSSPKQPARRILAGGHQHRQADVQKTHKGWTLGVVSSTWQL